MHSHEDLLTAFSLSAVLRLRRRFQALAELYRQQKGNTSCGAANRRSEKNAFSEAASIFPLRLLLRGLKGASSPFLVDPARRNRWWFSGSLLTSKENIILNAKALCPARRRAIPPTLPERKRANVPHGTLALSPHLCAAAVGMRTVYSMYPSRSSRCAVAGTPLSVIRRMAWSMVFTKMRTSFTIEMR